MTEEMMIVETECPMCGGTNYVEVPIDGYFDWEDGVCIQDAMPTLTPDEREMLISGICPHCWDRMFGGGE